MEHGYPSETLTAGERQDLLVEGQLVLRALGCKQLAREFADRSAEQPTREGLACLLLDYLQRARCR